MRRIGPFILLPLVWCLFTGSLADAAPLPFEDHLYFRIPSDGLVTTNAGTISYAGGTAPLVGSDIDVSSIVREVGIGTSDDGRCVQCTLNFSTGPFAGTLPAPEGIPSAPAGYLFSGGGSFQIIGGANFFGSSLPEGTSLLTGVPIDAFFRQSGIGSNEMVISIRGALNPQLLSHFGLPAGTYAGDIRIVTAEEGRAPNAFTLTTIRGNTGSDIDNTVFVQNVVPLPDTLWPFAVGFVALTVWWQWRKAFPLKG